MKLFKARYFERRICLKSTQLKQSQNKVNSANLLKRYTHTTNSIYMSWSSGFVFKGISHRRFKFEKCSKFDYHGQR